MIVYLEQLLSRGVQIIGGFLDQYGALPLLTPTMFNGTLLCCGVATALDIFPLSLATDRSYFSVLFGTGRGQNNHKRSVLTSDSDCTYAIACCLSSEVSRYQHNRGLLVLDLRFPVVLLDDR